jgi:hypothetical protein
MLEERVKLIDRDKWQKYLDKLGRSLRDHVNQILDQDGAGSCATESTSQALMVRSDWKGQEFVLLNPWFMYHYTSGGVDRGSSIDENLEFARNQGVAPESVWPRSKGWRATPSAEATREARKYRIAEFLDVTSIDGVGTALLNQLPVVFGWSGHSCVLTRLLSPTTAEYANSWGNWGDQGFGEIRLSSINFRYGAFAVCSTTVN